MKKLVVLFLLILAGILMRTKSHAQSPYAISPKWYFGNSAGISFPTSGAPSVLTGGKTGLPGSGQEASSTMCDPSGNVLFYTDSYRLYDGNNNFVQYLNGGTSSTNSSVCFPDPADPANYFYLITANEDSTANGNHFSNPNKNGIYWYRIHKTGTSTISVVAGPTQLAANNEVSEQLCAGSDGNGGYWVVTHQGGGAIGNQVWSWNFTSSGVGAKQVSSVAGTVGNNLWQGSLKINKCQNKLAAIFYGGKVEVYNWDQTTGKVTSLYRTYTGSNFGYGCEFSPDGNMLYFTSLVGTNLYQFDLVGNAVTTISTTNSNGYSEMGTLQLGPDDKIYVDNVAYNASATYVGVVNNPDVSGAGCNYSSTGFVLNSGSGNPTIYRGIANEAWINPTLSLSNSGPCKTIDFTYLFKTYFGSNVAVTAGSEQWDFGEGSGFQAGLGATPSHTYTNSGAYLVKIKVTDATCNKVWKDSINITVNNCGCTPPTAPGSITISTSRDLCSNFSGNIVFTANGVSAGDQVEWYTASCGGTLLYTGNPLTVPLASPLAGVYKYYVRSTNSCGNSSCITDSLIVHELPTAPASASSATAQYCAGSTGTVSLSATGGSGEKLMWYSSACGTGTSLGAGTPLSVSVPSSTTDYFVRWESASCPSSNCAQTTITIQSLPSPAISGTTAICHDSIQSLSTPATGNSFSWTYTTTGSGTITSGQSTNAITLDAGSAGGTLSVTETTALSCAQTVSVTVTLQAPSGPAAMAGQDKNVCTSGTQLDANAANGSWSVLSGTGIFSPDASAYNAVVSGLSSGLNEFVWTVNGRCGFTSGDQVNITMIASNLSLTMYTDADTLCFGTEKQIQVVPAGTGSGNYSYVWASSDNSFNQTSASPNIAVTPRADSTIYYLTIQDNVNTGCTASGQVTIYAMPNQELVIPNLITPNGDAHNDYLEIRDTNEMEILPGASLEILNRWGDRVYENSNYHNTWNATNLSDGVYYYRLESGCGSKEYKGWVQVMH